MQNQIPKLRHTVIISKKPGFLTEKLKTLTSFNTIEFNIFLLKFCTRFPLSNVYKRMCGIFLFCLDNELLIKVYKTSV